MGSWRFANEASPDVFILWVTMNCRNQPYVRVCMYHISNIFLFDIFANCKCNGSQFLINMMQLWKNICMNLINIVCLFQRLDMSIEMRVDCITFYDVCQSETYQFMSSCVFKKWHLFVKHIPAALAYSNRNSFSFDKFIHLIIPRNNESFYPLHKAIPGSTSC